MKKKLLSYKSIFIVFFFTLIIRIWELASLPHGFHVDEVTSGYIGRFILLNGKDVYGNPFPLLYFNTFGDFRTILPMYINGLSTFIFGVNEFAVRFPTAFLDSLIVFPIYSIANMIFNDKKKALIPAIVMAILPWNIVLARATSEAVLGLTIFVFGIMYLLRSVHEKKLQFLLVGNIFLFFSYFMYPTFRVLSPLVLLPLVFFIKNKKLYYVLSIGFFLLLTVIIAATPYGQGRYQQTSLLGSTELAARIHAKNVALSSSEGNNNVLASRIFYNKAVGYLEEFNNQYFSYFSPNFLFLQGGLPDRYVVPYQGLAYVTFAILLLGLLLPVTIKIQNSFYYYLLYLCIIAPLPAALTIEDVPNINRGIFLSFVLVMLVSIGFFKIFAMCKDKSKLLAMGVSGVLVLGILLEFVYFEHQYFVISPSYKPVQRNDGTKQLLTYLKQYDSNTKIILPLNNMPMYYLFFTDNFDKSLAGKFTGDLQINNIGNIYFKDNDCYPKEYKLTENDLKNTLFVERGDCPALPNYTELTTIYRSDSTRAFKVIKPISLLPGNNLK